MRRRAATAAQRNRPRSTGISAALRLLGERCRALPRSAFAAVGLLAVLAAVGVVAKPFLLQHFTRSPELTTTTVARNAGTHGTREILVTQRLVHSGEPLAPALVSFASRKPSEIPPDAVVELEELSGQVALAPIPAGYPVTHSALGRPVVILDPKPHAAPLPDSDAGGTQ